MSEQKLSMLGKIIEVLPERSGNSAKGSYKVQEYVVEETEGQYPKKMCFEVYGEDKIKSFNIQKGEIVEVFYNIDAREWNGRWFNSIKAWRINHIGNSSSVRSDEPVQTNKTEEKAEKEDTYNIKNEDELPF